MQVLFGILLLVYIPTLDPYPGYTPIGSEVVTDAAYDELPEGELICPERHANLLSSTYINNSEMLIPSPTVGNAVDSLLLKNKLEIFVKDQVSHYGLNKLLIFPFSLRLVDVTTQVTIT